MSLAAVVACGAPRPAHRDVLLPAPPISSALPAGNEDGGAPVRAIVEGCWRGSGQIYATVSAAAALPPLVPKKRYPTVFAFLTSDERAARVAALVARYPGRTFQLDEVGGVVSVAVELLPCAAREELGKLRYVSMNTAEIMKAFQAELVREMPDVPGLGSYDPRVAPTGSPPAVLFQAGARGADALAWALPKDLTDQALLAHYAGSRLRWTKEVVRTVVVPNRGSPCTQQFDAKEMGCDQPGRTREVIEHRVLGERPFSKRYLLAFSRKIVKVIRPGEVEVRKIATPEFDAAPLERDIFGSETSVLSTEGKSDITLTGPLSRDAVTGHRRRRFLMAKATGAGDFTV